MLSPRNVLITGANRGLGLELVKQFLKLPTPPQTLLATCRNPEEAKVRNIAYIFERQSVKCGRLIIVCS
jgi:NAD(P)-dependent dehydrogenase (short-subunit alcohol dehydrogenase family)